MTVTNDLVSWSFRWRVSRDVISCKECKARQIESDKGAVFEHSPGCRYASEQNLPWDELDRISRSFQR